MTDKEPDEKLTNPDELPTRGSGCIVDKKVGRWGPYRYHVTKHKGKQHWKYLGKTSKFVNGLVRKEDE